MFIKSTLCKTFITKTFVKTFCSLATPSKGGEKKNTTKLLNVHKLSLTKKNAYYNLSKVLFPTGEKFTTVQYVCSTVYIVKNKESLRSRNFLIYNNQTNLVQVFMMSKTTADLQKDFEILFTQIKKILSDLNDPELQKDIMAKLTKIANETKNEIAKGVEELQKIISELGSRASSIDSGLNINTDEVKKEIEELARAASIIFQHSTELAKELEKSVKEGADAAAKNLKKVIEDAKNKPPK